MPLARVDLCCNDWRNGMFVGRLLQVKYGELELLPDDWERGCAMCYVSKGTIRISRRQFVYNGIREWFGNWCWNAIWMPRKEAHRLICYLRESGAWSCDSGPTRLYDWFNGERVRRAK